MNSKFKSFLSDKSGQFSIVLAVAITSLMGAAGSAVDYSRAYSEQSYLQAALDSAALAAAKQSGTETDRSNIGNNYFFSNSRNPCNTAATFTYTKDTVTATSSCTVKTTFLGVLGITSLEIAATSTAIFGGSTPACMVVLEPVLKEAVMVNSDSRIHAPDCVIQINSSNAEALRGNSNGDVTAKAICVNGGWVRDSTSQFSPTPQKCPPVADPLAYLPVPSQATAPCTAYDLTVEGTKTLYPGVYCKKLELNSGANVTFMPGIYVIRDGEFIINSLSKATGNGVMFYLTGTNNPRFNVNSGSTIKFTAPTTGTYAGILFFQARNANADFSILNSDSNSIVEGAIYLKNTRLHLNSYGATSPNTNWTMYVVRGIEVNSHSNLDINFRIENSSVPLPAGLSSNNVVRLLK